MRRMTDQQRQKFIDLRNTIESDLGIRATDSAGYARRAEEAMDPPGSRRAPSADAKVIALGLLALAASVKESRGAAS